MEHGTPQKLLVQDPNGIPLPPEGEMFLKICNLGTRIFMDM